GEVVAVGKAASVKQSMAERVLLAPTGSRLQDLADVAVLSDELRHAVDVELNLAQLTTDKSRNLIVSDKAVITLDNAASLSLNSDTSIYMAGIINAPAGKVALNITPPAVETGAIEGQGIWLAAGSQINARSASVLTANDLALRQGEVFAAGSVTLKADRGYVVIQDGASIDVSAQAVTLDVLQAEPGKGIQHQAASGSGVQYQAVEVAPDAGAISLSAAEGVFIDGDLHADAARVRGAVVDGALVDGARGGELAVAIGVGNRGIDFGVNNGLPSDKLKFNFGSRDIVVSADAGDRLSSSLQPGDAIDSSLSGKAYVDVAKVMLAGIDSLTLTTSNTVSNNFTAASEIRFDTDAQLTLNNALVLKAPTINVDNHDVVLTAAYINLGTDSNIRNAVITTPVSGSGQLSLNSALLDVLGDVDISGNKNFVANVSQDIRFIGAISLEEGSLHGSLNTSADISLTARQLYPTTLSQFNVNLVNKPDGRIIIARSAGTAPQAAPVLSAAGSLSFNAAVIAQGGVVKAPLGQLAFNATDKIKLLPGSLTSVSADGAIIPFGTTVDSGTSWNYILGGVTLASELPQKSIELQAPDVAIESDAVVDLSAGGDAVAWEFVTGPTGKSDVLLKDTEGVFAVLPESVNQYAPYDPLLNDNNVAVGDQVYLSEGSGLKAGYYTLLPARYALLPGAKLVTELNAVNGIYPGKTLTRADGVAIIAGKHAVANSGIIDSTWSAFVVEDGSVARTRSQYIETLASDFFTSHSPLDAGSMVIEATSSLSLAGKINGDHADGTRGSRLDILADNIEVVDVAGVATAGFIQLTDDGINQLNVASMMLGGRRASGDADTAVSVKAGNIVIRENAQITSPELLLVATDNIEIKSGASLDASGAASSGVVESFVLDNNAAMLGVSVNPLAEVKRSGSGAGASIVLASGSALSADRSIIIDSSKNVQFDGDIDARGGGLRLGANQVNLGDVPLATPGLNLSAATLAGLNVEQLVISSFASLGIYEDVALSFNDLELIAPGINGISASGSTVTIAAQGNILIRQNGESASAVNSANNTLNVQAANVLLDGSEKNFTFAGFDNVSFTARESLQGTGQGAAVFDFGVADVVVDTPLISGDAGARLAISTTGKVGLKNTTAAAVDASAVNALGGQFQ
ncbi:MAG: hypothetical protein RQ982_08130, partial [Gammaproteobacteria bacterium]|nr:hypothetical protein [Gammaproteobacteria bacterium]